MYQSWLNLTVTIIEEATGVKKGSAHLYRNLLLAINPQ